MGFSDSLIIFCKYLFSLFNKICYLFEHKNQIFNVNNTFNLNNSNSRDLYLFFKLL